MGLPYESISSLGSYGSGSLPISELFMLDCRNEFAPSFIELGLLFRITRNNYPDLAASGYCSYIIFSFSCL